MRFEQFFFRKQFVKDGTDADSRKWLKFSQPNLATKPAIFSYESNIK